MPAAASSVQPLYVGGSQCSEVIMHNSHTLQVLMPTCSLTQVAPELTAPEGAPAAAPSAPTSPAHAPGPALGPALAPVSTPASSPLPDSSSPYSLPAEPPSSPSPRTSSPAPSPALPPVIELIGNSTVILQLDQTYIEQGGVSNDAVDGMLWANITYYTLGKVIEALPAWHSYHHSWQPFARFAKQPSWYRCVLHARPLMHVHAGICCRKGGLRQ